MNRLFLVVNYCSFLKYIMIIQVTIKNKNQIYNRIFDISFQLLTLTLNCDIVIYTRKW